MLRPEIEVLIDIVELADLGTARNDRFHRTANVQRAFDPGGFEDVDFLGLDLDIARDRSRDGNLGGFRVQIAIDQAEQLDLAASQLHALAELGRGRDINAATGEMSPVFDNRVDFHTASRGRQRAADRAGDMDIATGHGHIARNISADFDITAGDLDILADRAANRDVAADEIDRTGHIGVDIALPGQCSDIALHITANRELAAKEVNIGTVSVDIDFAANHLGGDRCGPQPDGQPQGHHKTLDNHNSVSLRPPAIRSSVER